MARVTFDPCDYCDLDADISAIVHAVDRSTETNPYVTATCNQNPCLLTRSSRLIHSKRVLDLGVFPVIVLNTVGARLGLRTTIFSMHMPVAMFETHTIRGRGSNVGPKTV